MLSNDWAEPLLIWAANSILSIFKAWHGSIICCYSGRTHVCQGQIFLDIECLLAITACGPCELNHWSRTDHTPLCDCANVHTTSEVWCNIQKCFLNYMSTFDTFGLCGVCLQTISNMHHRRILTFFVMMSWTLPWWCHFHHISNRVLLLIMTAEEITL